MSILLVTRPITLFHWLPDIFFLNCSFIFFVFTLKLIDLIRKVDLWIFSEKKVSFSYFPIFKPIIPKSLWLSSFECLSFDDRATETKFLEYGVYVIIYVYHTCTNCFSVYKYHCNLITQNVLDSECNAFGFLNTSRILICILVFHNVQEIYRR